MLKNAPRERLLAFYQKWYRPDNMAVVVVGDLPVAEAEALIQKRFGVIPAAKGAASSVDASVPGHKDTLISMSTDPEAQGYTVSMAFKGKVETDNTVRGYRKSLVEQLVSQMLNLRLAEISRRPNAPFLGAQAGGSSIGRTLELFEIEAAVPEGQITEGLAALMLEAKRMQQFGFSDEELNRAKAGLLYDYLDQTEFYHSPVAKDDRSLMNIPFTLRNADLDKVFIQETEAAELTQLKGHRSVGGMRASIYNAMPIEGVQTLVQFMREFERKHG